MTDNTNASYTVKDICRILNVSRTRAYEILNEIINDKDNTPPYIVHKIGKLIRIHKQSFDNWFNGKPYASETAIPPVHINSKGGC